MTKKEIGKLAKIAVNRGDVKILYSNFYGITNLLEVCYITNNNVIWQELYDTSCSNKMIECKIATFK